MIKLASHNSATYLPIRKWYKKLLKPFAQCQSRTMLEQYNAGVRLFDLRITFDTRTGKPMFAHGYIEYKYDVYRMLEEMNSYGRHLYVRIINERDCCYNEFVDFCHDIHHKYENLTFFGGINKKGWKRLYSEFVPDIPIIDKYSSWNNDTDKGTGWVWDDLYPRLYAWLFNRKWRRELGNTETFLMQDFVGVY